jgi:hypothetical protein
VTEGATEAATADEPEAAVAEPATESSETLAVTAEEPAADVESEPQKPDESKSPRQRGGKRIRESVPDEFDGEPLSAMAMAFAMAAPDLVVGDDEVEQTSDSGEAAAADAGEEQSS